MSNPSPAMSLKGKHILIVEDNVENRVVFQMIFIKHAANVEFERWGPYIGRHLRGNTQFDLIILDLMVSQGSPGLICMTNPHFTVVCQGADHRCIGHGHVCCHTSSTD